MSNKDCTRIYSKCKNKPVGFVKQGCFFKNIKGSKHMLHKPPAIAFDESTLEDAKQAGALRVQVTDQETGTIYRADIQRIIDKGLKINRGAGEQIALALNGWTIFKRGVIPAEQLQLWQGV